MNRTLRGWANYFAVGAPSEREAQAPADDLDQVVWKQRAIILETLAEQVTLLEQARDASRGSRKGIQAEMLKLMVW